MGEAVMNILKTALAFLFSLIFFTPAFAGALHVSPISIELSQKEPVSVLTLRNTGEQKSLVEIAAYRWTQQTGPYDLTPEPKLIVTKPIFVLHPRETKIVRVGLLTKTAFPNDTETSFRLLVDQTPLDADKQSVRMKIRLSLPVFLVPGEGLKASPKISLSYHANDKLTLRAYNPDNRHIRILGIKFLNNEHQLVRSLKNAAYILPRASFQQDLSGAHAANLHSAVIQYITPYSREIQEKRVSIIDEIPLVSRD